MIEKSQRTYAWPVICLCSFLGGALVFALTVGASSGDRAAELEQVYQTAYDFGYAEALQNSASLAVEEQAIGILSNATYFGSLEVAVKDISRQSNAIDLTYGEVGRARFRVPALGVGAATAHRFGNTLYVIKHVSVFANLRKATLEVTKITIPDSNGSVPISY